MKSASPVTIIIPLYGVQEYIEHCAVSLFEQDFKEIEYIFIDDASPDRSKEILQKVLDRYPQRKPHTRILTNPQNLGLYQTRKRGLYEAKGEYILHADSDDWVEPDMISSLYSKAKESNADIVSCDVFIEGPSFLLIHGQTSYTDNKELLEAISIARNRASVWNKLVRKSCYEKVYEAQDVQRHLNVGEDWLITIPLFFSTQNVAHIHRSLYHYNCKNSDSLTAKPFREKFFKDQLFVNHSVYNFLNEHGENYSRLFRSHIALPGLWQSFRYGYPIELRDLQLFGIDLVGLWRERFLSISPKILYSFYFLRVPGLARAVQKLVELYLSRREVTR